MHLFEWAEQRPVIVSAIGVIVFIVFHFFFFSMVDCSGAQIICLWNLPVWINKSCHCKATFRLLFIIWIQHAFYFERNELLINKIGKKVPFACSRRIWFDVNHVLAKFKLKNVLFKYLHWIRQIWNWRLFTPCQLFACNESYLVTLSESFIAFTFFVYILFTCLVWFSNWLLRLIRVSLLLIKNAPVAISHWIEIRDMFF